MSHDNQSTPTEPSPSDKPAYTGPEVGFGPAVGTERFWDTGVPPLPPPTGYASWLDFAVETFDTRGLWAASLFQDTGEADRDAMREAARSELRQLRQAAAARSNSDIEATGQR